MKQLKDNVPVSLLSFLTMLPVQILLFGVLSYCVIPAAAGVEIVDTAGQTHQFDSVPRRVVSIVPSVTEIICNLGAADSLKGVTYHGALPREKSGKTVVGGFTSPVMEKIEALDPDLVFVSKFQQKTIEQLGEKNIPYFYMDTPSFEGGMKNIQILADIFQRQKAGQAIVCQIRKEIELIRKKTDKIPEADRKRVFRLMGRDRIMTPARGAFLNDLVRFAGGIPMAPEGEGMVTEVSLAAWQAFNPQVIFGCGEDRKAAEKFFNAPGWKDVDAVRENRIYYFPCELTCRASSYAGYFVQWLSSYIYGDAFASPSNQVLQDEVLVKEAIALDLDIVADSQKILTRMADFKHKTLVLDFKNPQEILSTLEGFRDNVSTVGNHYLPPPAWSMPHLSGVTSVNERILKTIGRDPEDTALLMTGADMDNLSITEKMYRDMKVVAAVTAGVCSNAQRMSRAVGGYYEPGTINMIIMANMRLSRRAMARAVITATEAKSAALADLDIRSSHAPLLYQATGTGTDNIIIVQGEGEPIDGAGGHTKMGELIAKAVYDGVKKAVFLQNGLTRNRDVFQRLRERGLSVQGLADTSDCPCSRNRESTMARELEQLLLDPEYASMVEMAFTLSDAPVPVIDVPGTSALKSPEGESGTLSDGEAYAFTASGFFREMCHRTAEKIAGKGIDAIKSFSSTEALPVPLKMVFNAIMTGIDVLHALSDEISPESPGEPSAGVEKVSSFPMRIISLGPFLTKTVYLLGAGERLVADTRYCEDPEQYGQKEKIGTLTHVNVEKIISLKPDLVLASQFTKEKQLRVLEQFNIKTVQFKNPENFEKICSNTIYLGQLIGKERRAREIVKSAAARVQEVERLTMHLSPKRVFIQVGIKPIHTSNESTFVNEFIKRTGGINIAGKEDSGIYSREKVVKENPDVILISTMGSSKHAGSKEKRQWQAFNSMTAVKNNAVYLLDSEVICSPTPLIFAGALEDIARLIHPEFRAACTDKKKNG